VGLEHLVTGSLGPKGRFVNDDGKWYVTCPREQLILAEQFQVQEAGAAGQDVVGEVEHVVGLMKGEVALEQMEVGVEGIGQAQALDQQPTGAQATEAAATHLVGDVVVEVPIREEAATLLRPLPPAETEEVLVVVRERQAGGTCKHDYYLSNAAATTPLAGFARVAKAEHRVEECLQRAKGEAGLADPRQVRTS
jgi:hypothetical protein